MSTIGDSLWFIVHLELDIEILPLETSLGRLQVTSNSVREIWDFLWTSITWARNSRDHIPSTPRLQTLKISTRDHKIDPFTFEARLSERDDLAAKGHADIVSLELEGLLGKYGDGPLENRDMANFRSKMISRVEDGPEPTSTVKFENAQTRPLATTLSKMAEW